jgi:hypothetical protein
MPERAATSIQTRTPIAHHKRFGVENPQRRTFNLNILDVKRDEIRQLWVVKLARLRRPTASGFNLDQAALRTSLKGLLITATHSLSGLSGMTLRRSLSGTP